MKVTYTNISLIAVLLGLVYVVYLYNQGKLDLSMIGLAREGFADAAAAGVEGAEEEEEERLEEGPAAEGFRSLGVGYQTPGADADATAANPHAAAVGHMDNAGDIGSYDPESHRFAAVGADGASGVASNDAASCYTQNGLNPSDLLPAPSAEAAQFTASNPPGQGSPDGRNYLDPKYTIGINTVGQSNRNPSYDLRSEPPIPACPSATPFNQSTIAQTPVRKVFEIGSQLSCGNQPGNY